MYGEYNSFTVVDTGTLTGYTDCLYQLWTCEYTSILDGGYTDISLIF